MPAGRLLAALAIVVAGCAGDPAPVGAPSEPAASGPPAVAVSAEAAAERAVGVGDRAPDFALPGADGAEVRLADLLLDGPVVLTFYRGGWCPYCNTQLRDYQRALADVEAAGARLVAVSPERPDSSLTTAERNGLAFPVLSDVGGGVSRAYGLVFRVDDATRERYRAGGVDLARYNGLDGAEGGWALPVPATYVIDRSGTVRAAFVEADYTQRASPRQVLDALRALA